MCVTMSHPSQGVLIQNMPQGENGWDMCTFEIGGAWQFLRIESLYVVFETWSGIRENANLRLPSSEYSKAELS
ncbi:hypothetical protein F0562_015607 [Nyssa sinensis]|uniref:Uncharacterized protein n=1 Tax=Nyssa sinensis TaxID=561372 RepID=A0A5J4ZHG2_9ASTE|nr:hypothetical protein F0562_015607 [Nyssa sinensis]